MRKIRKEDISNPFVNTTKEEIYEMIGKTKELGSAKHHSFGHVIIPEGCSSRLHYHPIAEETYYILSGQAKMIIDEQEYILMPEDTVLVETNERHQIFSIGNSNLEFLVVCSPAWEPNNSIYLD